MPSLLEVKALKAYYGQTQALYDVGFDLAEGGITTLLGANGAGKTTTLRAICNMVRTEGEVRFAGKDVTGRPTEEIVRQRIAHVPEGRGTFTTLTVDQNAALALDLATQAYVLETGRVVMSGPSAVVKNDENVRKSYLGY